MKKVSKTKKATKTKAPVVAKSIYELRAALYKHHFDYDDWSYDSYIKMSKARRAALVKAYPNTVLCSFPHEFDGKNYNCFVFGYEGKAYIVIGCRTFTIEEARIWWLAKLDDFAGGKLNNMHRYVDILCVLNGRKWLSDYMGCETMRPFTVDWSHSELNSFLKDNKLDGFKRKKEERDFWKWNK